MLLAVHLRTKIELTCMTTCVIKGHPYLIPYTGILLNYLLSNMKSLYDVCYNLFRISADFQEAVKLKPTFSDAYLNLGNVYKVSFFYM